MIYLGTSGYSYDDWRGVYYPAEVARSEWLTFYSSEFEAVELNYTYYRMPSADQLRGFAERTPDGFRFAVKAHQDITHNRAGDPAPFAQFRAALVALQRTGKLGAVLLQFPSSFRVVDDNVDYLQLCFDRLPDLPLAVEFRRGEWLTQRTLDLLREREVGFCNVDMPELRNLMPKTKLVTAPLAYVRFHGRNRAKWWRHDKAWERYNYTYSEEELAEWIPPLREMDNSAETLFAFANNHWEGQSVSAIRQLRLLLGREDEQ
jgi:uncharacterized protein YecE (DUF72 family)